MNRSKLQPQTSSMTSSIKKQVQGSSEYLKQNPFLIFVCIVLVLVLLTVILYNTNDQCKNSIDVVLAKISVKGMFNEDLNKKIKELDVLFFMSPTCPWCKKMVEVLKREGTYDSFKVIDVTSPEGSELGKKLGVLERGVPNFVCLKLSTGVVGFKETTKEIIDALTDVKSPSEPVKAPQANLSNPSAGPTAPTGPSNGNLREALMNTGLIMFKMEGCGHCNRVMDELKQNGLTDAITIVDSKNPEMSKILQELKINVEGFPTFFCRSNGKTVVGGRPLKDIIDVCMSA